MHAVILRISGGVRVWHCKAFEKTPDAIILRNVRELQGRDGVWSSEMNHAEIKGIDILPATPYQLR